MASEDKPKGPEAHAGEGSPRGSGDVGAPEEPTADIEFDLIDDPGAEDDDVFGRDTAIPDSPPEYANLAGGAEATTTSPAMETHAPAAGRPPPKRHRRMTPVTLEPPSLDLELDAFNTPTNAFAESDSPGDVPTVAPSERPTAPPSHQNPGVEHSPLAAPRGRAHRAAFLAETARNPAPNFDGAAYAGSAETTAVTAKPGSPSGEPTPALSFVESQGALPGPLRPLSPITSPDVSLEAPTAPPRGPNADELERAYAVGDYTRALEISEGILARAPDDAKARRYARDCREVLTQMFVSRIGPLDQVVTVVVRQEEVQWLSLDHRAGFLLSLVDGQSTVDELLDISGMSRLDALRIIHDLEKRHVVQLA